MTRRTFLRVLGSAAVGAAVVLTLPLPQGVEHAAIPREWPRMDTTAGPLTFAQLEQAYRACSLGPEVPTVAVVSSSIARLYGLVYDVEIAEAYGL